MLTKEFLEDYPLYRKFQIQLPERINLAPPNPNFIVPAINSYCPVCKSVHTFSGSIKLIGTKKHKDQNKPAGVYSPDLLAGRLGLIESVCASCHDYCQFFIIYFDEERQFIFKAGQFPSWSISIERKLEDFLGEYAPTFKNGLICESQSYGIGAYAYYRRIVEEIIDSLLEEISSLLVDAERKKFDSALKNVQQGTVASKKIALVKDLLPNTLRPNGINPLNTLYGALSEGIHSLSDEECLENAADIRKGLTYLVEQISLANEAKESSYSFIQSMKNLQDKQRKS